jgi:eukaryotic-like serine/threonine-protein kinase
MTTRRTPEGWQRIKGILDEALDLPEKERAAFIAGRCGGDEEMQREIESLAAAADGWTFVDQAAEGPAVPAIEGRWPPPAAGDRVGAYELLSELGQGGMGMVYLARRADDHFQKKVAVKLIRPGMASEFSLQRFRSERQISASLEHPNIARLLDGGATPDGKPYFVLEYVEGEPLTEYCESRSLSIPDRLRLFLEVCGPVMYAHQNLVVHRDIKPRNILVTPEGEPKLLDFGIAKLLQPDGGPDAAAETATLFRMMTPDYASPEQIRGERITTASDVYALGVVLYELLAGKKPYAVTGNTPGELLRVVCERDPEKPSAAANSRELRGDLDAIVAKAMRKEPERRYVSVAEFADDIRRHLAGRPVLARRGTLVYRTGKFARRHRIALAAAAVAAVALVGGVVATLREARRARTAEANAQRRYDDLRKLASAFLFEFDDAIRDLPGSTPARALVVQRALQYLDDLSRAPEADHALRRELAEAYMKVGDVQGNSYMANLGDVPGAIRSYDKAIGLLEPLVQAGTAHDEMQATLSRAYLTQGGIRLITGDAAGAIAQAEKGLDLSRRLAERRPDDPGRALALATAWQYYAFDLSAAGRDAEAYEALKKQATILRTRLADDPQDREIRRSLHQNLYLVGEAIQDLDPAGSQKAYAEAVAIGESLRAEDPASVLVRRDLAYLRTGMGGFYESQKDFAAAREQFQHALSLFESIAAADAQSVDGRVGIAISLHNIGNSRAGEGDAAGALRDFAKARTFYEPIVAADPSNAWAEGALADLYLIIGQQTEKQARSGATGEGSGAACAHYARAHEIFERLREAGKLTAVRIKPSAEAAGAVARCRGIVASSASGPAAR